ncbi:hypothetical protein [Streptomyces sp. NPDC001401]|uniref:hypothetical protein n=1 Tax=Streptomyces sp. NPDC001401 TaxID=3364570 RepID=UPI00369CEAB9
MRRSHPVNIGAAQLSAGMQPFPADDRPHALRELRRSLPEEQHRPETGALELAVATALLGLRHVTEARTRAAAADDAAWPPLARSTAAPPRPGRRSTASTALVGVESAWTNSHRLIFEESKPEGDQHDDRTRSLPCTPSRKTTSPRRVPICCAR